jgi:hypothetical protein
MTPTRLYIVELSGSRPRLVEAASRSQAVNHVVRSMVKVKAATPKDVASLVGQGIELEQAKEQIK